ncbi:MAG: MCE family protein [Nocardiaceae bacterium]|nr:MCE family protein [Nocardiaceae bacterium]
MFWLGVAGVILIGVLILGSSAWKVAGIGQNSVKAEFEQAAGMKAGQKVKTAGITVGSVKSVALENDRVVATLDLDKDVKLGPDAFATIKLSTILGSQYVELKPGNGKGLPDDRIKLSNTAVPFSLAKLVYGTDQDPNSFDPNNPNQFNKLENIDTKKLAEALDAVNHQFGQNPQDLINSLDALGVIGNVVAKRQDQFEKLLKNTDSVSQVLSENHNSVLAVVTQGQAIFTAIEDRETLIKNLLDNVATMSEQLKQMGIDNADQFGGLIDQLNTLGQGLTKNRDNLARLYEIMPVTFRQLANASGNGNYIEVFAPWLFPDNWLCAVNVIPGCR